MTLEQITREFIKNSREERQFFDLNRDLQMNGGDITSTEINDLPKSPFLCGQFGNFEFLVKKAIVNRNTKNFEYIRKE